MLTTTLQSEVEMTKTDIDPETGLTEQETEFHDTLQKAWGLFLKLPIQHPDDQRDCCDAIHRIQDLLAMRIARRSYPKCWINHSPTTGGS